MPKLRYAQTPKVIAKYQNKVFVFCSCCTAYTRCKIPKLRFGILHRSLGNCASSSCARQLTIGKPGLKKFYS